MLEKIKRFYNEVRTELRKVVWPSREDVISSTSVVLITICIIGVFLWFVDIALQGLVSQLMK